VSKAKAALGAIRDLPTEELGQAVDKARDELFRLKLSGYTNQVQDTASIRKKRRELARILTVLHGRTRGAEVQGSGEAAAAASAASLNEVEPSAKPAKAGKPAKAKAKGGKPAAQKAAKPSAAQGKKTSASTTKAKAAKKPAKKKED
jgi:large subunit ribosomal protein L29